MDMTLEVSFHRGSSFAFHKIPHRGAFTTEVSIFILSLRICLSKKRKDVEKLEQWGSHPNIREYGEFVRENNPITSLALQIYAKSLCRDHLLSSNQG